MSQYNYITKPDWSADGKFTRASASGKIYPAPMGWVAPAAGKAGKATTSLTWATGVVTVVATGHGLVSGQGTLITGVTAAGYNGYQIATVTDANTFTYPLTADPGAASVQGIVYKNVEVVVAISNLKVVNADAAVGPTYTAAVSYSGIAAMVTGNVITVTLTASEAVEVMGAKIALTVGANTRQMTFDDLTSTGTSLKFKYTIVASDLAIAGGVVVAGTTSTGQVADVLSTNKKTKSLVTFTPPVTSTATAN